MDRPPPPPAPTSVSVRTSQLSLPASPHPQMSSSGPGVINNCSNSTFPGIGWSSENIHIFLCQMAKAELAKCTLFPYLTFMSQSGNFLSTKFSRLGADTCFHIHIPPNPSLLLNDGPGGHAASIQLGSEKLSSLGRMSPISRLEPFSLTPGWSYNGAGTH